MRALVAALGCLALVVSSQAAAQDIAIESIPFSDTSSSLRPTDRNSQTGDIERVYVYNKVSQAPERLVLELRSVSFDAYLELTWPNRQRQVYNDDFAPPARDARLVVDLDETGTYRIRVTSFLGSSIGRYSLDIQRSAQSVTALPDTIILRVCRPSIPLAATTDFAQPRFFVRIVESYRGDTTVIAQPILDSAASVGQAKEIMQRRYSVLHTDEVDIRSSIGIRFDRAYLRELGYELPELSLTVTAEVTSEAGSREVEVPGYSIIGETRRRTGAQARIPEVYALLCGIHAWFDAHGNTLIAEDRADTVRALVRQAFPYVEAPLRSISDTNNRMIRFIAARARRDPRSIAAGVVRLIAAMSEARDSATPPLNLAVLRSDLVQLKTLVTTLLNASGASGIAGSAEQQIAAIFKDTDLPIERTGARPGDFITITVSNDALGDSLPRTFVVRLRVVEYGLTHKLSDSFLLLHRSGFSAAERERVAASVRASAQQLRVDQLEVVPGSANFAPAPGASYGWSWYPRRSSIIRWLRPRFGVNVSFPRFTTFEIRARVRADTTLPVPPATDTTVSILTESEETETAQSFQIASGVVLGLFGGAVEVTWGWNLTTESRRRYWGIGFSFARLAERLRDAGGGPD